MGELTAVELHARRPSDVPHLQALDRALRELGIEPQLSAGHALARGPFRELPGGPLPCELRVLVEDPHDPLGPPSGAAAERLAVLWTSAADPAEGLRSVPALLLQADLVLVPGAQHAQALDGRIPGAVEAVGLPALDGWSRANRERIRSQLHLPRGGKVWLYAPSSGGGSPALWLGERIEALCEDGVFLAICAAGWPSEWREHHRELAARWPGMVMLEEADPARLLAAADAVCSDATALLFAAFALGVPAVRLERRLELRDAARRPCASSLDELRAALLDPRVSPAPQLLEPPGRAAERAARRIAQLCAPPVRRAAGGREPAATQAWAEPIESRIAFGDLDGALAALRARAELDGGPAPQRMLASVQRLRRDFAAAEIAGAAAEERARDELARALCEQARIDVECGRFDAARERFGRAAELAPELADAPVGLGSLALHAGDGPGAEAQFRAALRLEKSGRAWSGLGLALCAQGRSRDALSALQAALDLDADGEAALYGLVQASLQTGELQAAEARLGSYVERHPGNLGFAFSLAAIAFELGHREAALRQIEQIELFDPRYPGLAELKAKLQAA